MWLKRIMSNIVKLWQNLPWFLIAMMATYFYILFYWPRDDSASNYVPKSKRWNRLKRMKKWVKTKVSNATVSCASMMLMALTWWGKLHNRRRSATRMRHRSHILDYWSTGSRRPPRRRIPYQLGRRLLANAALAHRTTISNGHVPFNFDTDSETVGVDNRCSGCISDKEYHFENLRPSDRVIKGFGGSRTTHVMIGTLVWRIQDDDGKTHVFRIPNSYYVPSGKMRLLSPQHVDKVLRRRGSSFREQTDSRECILTWGDRGQFRKTIQVDEQTNVFTFRLAPGYSNFHAYCAECNINDEEEDDDPLAMDARMVSDD